MGLSEGAVKLFLELYQRNIFEDLESVIEMGSQELHLGKASFEWLVEAAGITDYDKEAGVLAIQAARKMNPPPAIPEEANKHFIYAITALKNAGNKADLGVAIGEYKLAIKNAPWVPDYYWNLSLAYEQAEQFEKSASMLEDFKTIALNFPNPQVIEDKIFELQYKQKEQGKKQEQERLAQEKIQREQNYATQQRERCSKKCGDDANIFNIFESYESFARKLDACQARCKTRY